jgi:hypothetical protein
MIPFGPGSFSLSVSLLRKRNGLCVTFCGGAVGFEGDETIGMSVNGDMLDDDWPPSSWGRYIRGLMRKRFAVLRWRAWL